LNQVFDRVKELDSWGVDFLKDKNGRFERLEGQGSSEKRPIKTIMFHGPQLMDVLRVAAQTFSVDIGNFSISWGIIVKGTLHVIAWNMDVFFLRYALKQGSSTGPLQNGVPPNSP